jgi:4-amino-4-deoxy-L-arabinose transferase-like glycosyltransferase
MNKLFQRKNIVFLSILIAIYLVWFIAGMIWQHNLNGDSDEYIFLAENIKHGFYYGWDTQLPIVEYYLTKRTPLYPLLMMGSYQIFGFHQWPILILQNILSIASCYIILDLFRKLFPAIKHLWIYFVFLLVYPSQMFFASVLTPDTNYTSIFHGVISQGTIDLF